jgi:hypothetical protein
MFEECRLVLNAPDEINTSAVVDMAATFAWVDRYLAAGLSPAVGTPMAMGPKNPFRVRA